MTRNQRLSKRQQSSAKPRGEPSEKRSLRTAVVRIAGQYGWALAGAIYWRLQEAYCLTRIAALNGEIDVKVADETVRFGLSTRGEYLRATNLGGERAMIAALLRELDGTETVWDIGASVGTYTCFVASALTTGCVIGFEPEATNRAHLRENLMSNASEERWTIAPIALSNQNGTMSLSSEYIEAGSGHHYLSTETTAPRVETKRGDSLIDSREIGEPNVLKIDVQGAELLVLKGMGTVLETVDSIYLEVHPEKCGRYGTTAGDVETFLRAVGFSLTPLGIPTNRRSGVYLIHAKR